MPFAVLAQAEIKGDLLFDPVLQADHPAPTEGVIPADEPITVDHAEAPSNESYGIRTAEKGGLPFTMWEGTPRNVADAFIALLNAPIGSVSGQGLATALLTSEAALPEGEGKSNFLMLRLNALVAIGAEKEAIAMLQALPKSLATDDMTRLQFELLLLAPDTAKACALAREQVAVVEGAYWQRATVYCNAAQGKRGEAELGLGVLRETDPSLESWFEQALDKISGGHAAVAIEDSPVRPTLFEAAVLLAASEALQLKDYLDIAPPVIVRRVAALENANAEVKAVAQERLAMLEPSKRGGAGLVFSDQAMPLPAHLSEKDARRALRTYSLLRALGFKVTQSDWKQLTQMRVRYTANQPSPLLMERLKKAAEEQRVGEVALYAMLALGSGSLAELPDPVLAELVAALHEAGLDKEARAIASEAVVAVGEDLPADKPTAKAP